MAVTKEQMQAYIQGWKRAAPVLEALRNHEIRQASTPEAIEMLDGCFKAAMRRLAPDCSSGLVIQQQLFSRLIRK